MRIKKVTRYYCDHCAKGGFFRGRMEAHEKGCTKNPNRECGLCRVAGEDQQTPEVLMAALQEDIATNKTSDDYGVEIQLDKLRTAANHCPACILATIRKTELFFVFNVREEFESFWKEFNTNNESHY